MEDERVPSCNNCRLPVQAGTYPPKCPHYSDYVLPGHPGARCCPYHEALTVSDFGILLDRHERQCLLKGPAGDFHERQAELIAGWLEGCTVGKTNVETQSTRRSTLYHLELDIECWDFTTQTAAGKLIDAIKGKGSRAWHKVGDLLELVE